MLIFEVRLPLKKPLVTTLTEARALTFRNYEVKKRTECSKIIKKQKIHCLLSFQQPNFWDWFNSKTTTGDYFRWNACIHFQKTCRCSNAKLTRNIWNFLVTLLRFYLRKTIIKSKFSYFFLPLKESSVAAFKKTCTYTSRKYVSEPGNSIADLS